MRQSDPTRQASEVRRCAKCGEASLVCVREWQHRRLGLATPSRTLELECRSCGAKVTLLPWLQIRIERAFAFLMLPAIFPSIYFFASARRKARAWTENPLVDGAVLPLPDLEEPLRSCPACGGTAHCTAIARKETRWVSLGMRYRYVCGRCSSTFTVHDNRAVGVSLVIACALAAMGALLVSFPPGSAVGAEKSNRWFGVALLVLSAVNWASFAVRLRSRSAYPIVK